MQQDEGREVDVLEGLTTAELAQRARAALNALALQADPAAFGELLQMNAYVGVCLGEAARTLAASGSWAQVADVSGTTKQAAWSRWKA